MSDTPSINLNRIKILQSSKWWVSRDNRKMAQLTGFNLWNLYVWLSLLWKCKQLVSYAISAELRCFMATVSVKNRKKAGSSHVESLVDKELKLS